MYVCIYPVCMYVCMYVCSSSWCQLTIPKLYLSTSTINDPITWILFFTFHSVSKINLSLQLFLLIHMLYVMAVFCASLGSSLVNKNNVIYGWITNKFSSLKKWKIKYPACTHQWNVLATCMTLGWMSEQICQERPRNPLVLVSRCVTDPKTSSFCRHSFTTHQ